MENTQTKKEKVKIVVVSVLAELKRKKFKLVKVRNKITGENDICKIVKIFSDTNETILMLKNIKTGQIGFTPKMTPDFYIRWIDENEVNEKDIVNDDSIQWEKSVNSRITGTELIDMPIV